MELCYAMATGTVPVARRETNINPFPFSSKPIFFPNQQSIFNNSSIRFGSLTSTSTSASPPDRNPGHTLSEQKLNHEGIITESLPNAMFRVKLDGSEDELLGYVSGRIRKMFIRILPGDRVKVEVSRYDSTKGRITYRFPSRVRDLDAPNNKNKNKNNRKGRG